MDWPHAPLHRFVDGDAIYFVTGATYLKKHIYRTAARLDGLQSRIFDLARAYECSLQAWSIFSNHYHLVVSADGDKVRCMLTRLHTLEGIDGNEIDGTPGRKVWYQFRETELTFERSWLARLRYTLQNPVHHRVVPDATLYRWCSASWFERTSRPAFVNVVKSFPIDRVNVADDFQVDPAGELGSAGGLAAESASIKCATSPPPPSQSGSFATRTPYGSAVAGPPLFEVESGSGLSDGPQRIKSLTMIRARVITCSDAASRGERVDRSGPAVREILAGSGYEVDAIVVVADEVDGIAAAIEAAAGDGARLIVTTGGTGIAARDVTPEATWRVCEKVVPGFGEVMRTASLQKTAMAPLSRAQAATRGTALIVNLPGSESGARENLQAILHLIPHALQLLEGKTAH